MKKAKIKLLIMFYNYCNIKICGFQIVMVTLWIFSPLSQQKGEVIFGPHIGGDGSVKKIEL